MKIGIYDPYLNTMGGGEKYVLESAQCLASSNKVFLFWNLDQEEYIRKNAKERFNLSLENVIFAPNIFNSQVSLVSRLLAIRKYDVIFFVSDGSIPFLLSKKNILLFQFPVNWVKPNSFLNLIKLKRISKIICYSDFVKNFLDKKFSTDSLVLSPYVDISFPKQEKENIILSVGRFTKKMNAKKQNILIDVFKKIEPKLKNWKLILIGSALPEDKDFVDFLKKEAKGHSIEILVNVPFEELKRFYPRAKIYWHACGFGEDLQKYPEKAEHFGISTVEAMGAGCVPVVINAGGQREIVIDGQNGLLWNSIEEFQLKTLELTKNDSLLNKLSKQAMESAKKFSKEKFCLEINNLVLQ